jgi:hypothetical protein
LRRFEQVLWWIGVGLIAAGLVMLVVPGAGRLLAGALIGVGLAALGVNMILGGELVAGPEPRGFSARGDVARGYLDVAAGLCDLLVRTGPSNRIAAVRYGPVGRPEFTVEGGVARLRLASQPLRPNITRWEGNLADNILWDVQARSSLGHLRLDLREMRLQNVTAHTSLGAIRVVCPLRGFVTMELSSFAGDVEVIVPVGVGARVTVEPGPLATFTLKNERLLAEGQRRYATPSYETAESQVEIAIRCTAGDIVVS